MAGPYGIEPVNVLGVLGAVQQMRAARTQEMLQRQQLDIRQDELNRMKKRESLVDRVFGNQGASSSTTPPPYSNGGYWQPQPEGGDPVSSGVAPGMAGAATLSAPPSALVDPARLPPRTDGATINTDALRQLYAIDPQTAKQLQDGVYSASKAQLEHTQLLGQVIGTAAYRLKQLPPEQRAAEFRAMIPSLQQYGLGQEQFSQIGDLSDQTLDRFITMGQSLKELVTPKLRNVGADHVVIDERTNREVYQSPYIKGADGTLYANPNAGAVAGASGAAPPAPASGNPTEGGFALPDQVGPLIQSLGPQGFLRWQQQHNVPVRVNNPQEAAALPRGTLMVSPSGQIGRKR